LATQCSDAGRHNFDITWAELQCDLVSKIKRTAEKSIGTIAVMWTAAALRCEEHEATSAVLHWHSMIGKQNAHTPVAQATTPENIIAGFAE
jgi:hypothetical protein